MTQATFLQYQDAMERVLRYDIIHNGLPNYVEVNGEKISKADYIDAVKRVQAFLVKEKVDPRYVNMGGTTSPGTIVPTPIPVTKGVYICQRYRHNMDQGTGYWCAPFTEAQIIYELYGLDVAQSYLAQVSGTTTDGTGHPGIIKGLETWDDKAGHDVSVDFQNFSSTGWQKCAEMVADPNIGLGFHVLYRNHTGWGHYMFPVIIDMNKKQITLMDSLNSTDMITVSFAEFEKWIANTPYNQPSCLIVKKIK